MKTTGLSPQLLERVRSWNPYSILLRKCSTSLNLLYSELSFSETPTLLWTRSLLVSSIHTNLEFSKTHMQVFHTLKVFSQNLFTSYSFYSESFMLAFALSQPCSLKELSHTSFLLWLLLAWCLMHILSSIVFNFFCRFVYIPIPIINLDSVHYSVCILLVLCCFYISSNPCFTEIRLSKPTKDVLIFTKILFETQLTCPIFGITSLTNSRLLQKLTCELSLLI